MAVYLSPGVYTRETDISQTVAGTGALTPAFIGTAKRGPVQQPVYITNAQQFIDTFGEPFPESYLGYAALAYFEQGASAWVLRVGVECEDGQADALGNICIDTSGARGKGWGRVPLFSGINYGKICTRVIDASHPMVFHAALTSDIEYTDVNTSTTDGPCTATLNFVSLTSYTGSIDDIYTILITGAPTAGSVMDGATYQIVTASEGVILSGTIIESGVPGTSTVIDVGDGLLFTIVVTAGGLGVGDNFTFRVQPDNRVFSFNVDRQGTSESAIPGAVVQYTMPAATYTSAADLVAAIAILVPSSEPYLAVAQSDDTVCFQTDVAGRNIQLVSTEAFALEIGRSLYSYDIPRSYLESTSTGPYIINANNNKISMQVISSTTVVGIEFNLPTSAAISVAALATQINAAGIYNGSRYWRSFAMTIPGGEDQVFIETYLDHQFDQLKMLADLSHFKTLNFAETLSIQYPFTRPYIAFTDSRAILPESSANPAIPESCAINPGSAQCAIDSAYYQNIVGFIVATSAGTWIDDYRVTMTVTSTYAGVQTPTFRVSVVDANNQVVESVENVVFDPREDRYIGNVINPGSKYGGTNGNSYINWIERPSFLNNDPVDDPTNFEVRVPGVVVNKAFSGGTDGIPLDPAYSSEIDRAIIGNAADESGMFAFQNPELYDISLLVIPGVSSGAVIGQALQLCEARGDCIFLVDPPFGLRPQQVVDWHNGILLSELSDAIDSSYGALYHPWLKIYDQFSGEYIFVPPSGHLSSVYASTTRDTEMWFAPAGLRRGRLLTPVDTEVDLTLGERDLMYGSGNAVNPIVNFTQDGITVWGQRTLQRVPSALDRVNVRMLLTYIKKNATRLLRSYVFEPNDSITRSQVTTVCNSFLGDVAGRRGLDAYNVVCDERNNTPERIDRGELHVAFFLKPTRVAEFVVLNLVILQSSASFGAESVLAAGGVVA